LYDITENNSLETYDKKSNEEADKNIVVDEKGNGRNRESRENEKYSSSSTSSSLLSQEDSAKLYLEAEQCEQSGDYVRARTLYTLIVERSESPQSISNVLNHLGIITQKDGDLDQALLFFQQALQVNPQHGEVYNNLANLYTLRGDIESAIRSYRTALSHLPTCAEIYLNLASLLQSVKDHNNEAIAVLREGVSALPTDFRIHSALAKALQQDNQLDAAIAHHYLALQHAPEPTVLLLTDLAVALMQREEYDTAQRYIQQALLLPVVNNEPHKAMASLLYREGKVEEVITYLNRAIEINPSDAFPYYHLAVGILLFSIFLLVFIHTYIHTYIHT
jgi:tetratricopeptide (TPR) repeat protein